MRRMFWAALSPFVWLLHRAGVLSYAWVNVCKGARRPDLFDPLWQHQRYGAVIPALPAEVTLRGIGYRTAVAEGTVTFVAEFTRCRITFERDPHDRMADLWYLEVAGRVPASHVDAAYGWVRAVFGGSFQRRAVPV